MLTESKKLRLVFILFSALCVVALVAAVITDLVINKSLTWAKYVMAAVPFGWLIISPLVMVRKHRIVWSIVMLTLSVFPFLFVVDKLTPVSGWFSALAVPVGIAVILAVWITFFSIKFLKVGKWYLCSFLVFIWGVCVNFTIQFFVRGFIGRRFLTFDSVFNFISNFGCVVLLAVIGYYSVEVNKKKQEYSSKPEASVGSSEPPKPEIFVEALEPSEPEVHVEASESSKPEA